MKNGKNKSKNNCYAAQQFSIRLNTLKFSEKVRSAFCSLFTFNQAKMPSVNPVWNITLATCEIESNVLT